jgi:hypothetical protein
VTLYLVLRLAKMLAVGAFFGGAIAATLPGSEARRGAVLPWLLVGFLGTLLLGLALLSHTHRSPLATWVWVSILLSLTTVISAMGASAPDSTISPRRPSRRRFWRVGVLFGLLAITSLMVLRPS